MRSSLAVQAAAIKEVETVDECVGKAVAAIKEENGQLFICADHGNAEQLIDYETGEPFTAHTTNPVPFILDCCSLYTSMTYHIRVCEVDDDHVIFL